MRLLYIGDIMGEPGIQVVSKLLPKLKAEENIDVVGAQAENVTNGKGISKADFDRLKGIGVDFFTGGNHVLSQSDILPVLSDPNQPIVRPANYPEGTPGLGYKYLSASIGDILFVTLLGQIVGKDSDKPIDNPLKTIDSILEAETNKKRVATIVNFHGDYSSEKVVIGHYLDGRVSAVVGDHWHVPTADARVLTKGTAHITDVGMCGVLNSSLGVDLSIIINRWRDGSVAKNELETDGPFQFSAVIIDIDDNTGLATSIKQVQEVIDS